VIQKLSRSYIARDGAPVISGVDTRIFHLQYFTHCSQCNFCHDWCCSFGVELDLKNVERIQAKADALEKLVRIDRNEWFENEVVDDEEFPGGKYTGTNVINDACVFLNRSGRGCLLHSYSMQKGLDYHHLKPIVCVIYPLTFSQGILLPADEIEDRSLVCMDEGLTLYHALKDELAFYFGSEFVTELNEIEWQRTAEAQRTSSS
jgi:Fe-S-cluster containining protein